MLFYLPLVVFDFLYMAKFPVTGYDDVHLVLNLAVLYSTCQTHDTHFLRRFTWQQVVTGAPDEHLQSSSRQVFCTYYRSKHALERREHQFLYAVPAARLFELFRTSFFQTDFDSEQQLQLSLKMSFVASVFSTICQHALSISLHLPTALYLKRRMHFCSVLSLSQCLRSRSKVKSYKYSF